MAYLEKPGRHPKGRVTKDWLKFRRQYLKDNPPNFEGWYECAICGLAVGEWAVELDHIKNRSTHPHLRFDPNNIQLVHSRCNTNKKLNIV